MIERLPIQPNTLRKGATLALALVALAGCSSRTVGNGFVGPKGQCTEYTADVPLKDGQKLYLSGEDMSIDGTKANHELKDYALLTNVDGSLKLDVGADTGGDPNDSKVRLHTKEGSVNPGDQIGLSGNQQGTLTYSEQGRRTDISFSKTEGQTIIVQLDQHC